MGVCVVEWMAGVVVIGGLLSINAWHLECVKMTFGSKGGWWLGRSQRSSNITGCTVNNQTDLSH